MNDECPRCREYADRGSMFCGACGRRIVSNECPECEKYAAGGYSFCGVCGRALGGAERGAYPSGAEYKPVPERPRPGILESILLVVCMAVIVLAVFEAITLLVNFPGVSSFLLDKYVNFFLLVPYPHTVFSLDGIALQIYWVFVGMVILLCLITAIHKFAVKIKAAGRIDDADAVEDTAFFWVGVFLSASIFISFIVSLIVLLSGSDLNTPDFGNMFEQMFSLADAGVWEEIVARVVYIGVPMVLISLVVTKKKESVMCLFGGFGMSRTAVALIIISGMIFGMAHYPGWENQLWKVVTAGIMGVFLGYLFVRFGLYASILLHFVNDYLSSFDWMGVGGFLGVVSLLLLAAGIAASIYILKRLLGSGKSFMSLSLFRNGYIKGGS